jgi:hypothetical protein
MLEQTVSLWVCLLVSFSLCAKNSGDLLRLIQSNDTNTPFIESELSTS